MATFKSWLKYVNSMPFHFTIKHYQTFGDASAAFKDNSLNFPESWDVLRRSHPHFSIPEERAQWLETAEVKVTKDGQDGGLIRRAQDVAALLKRENIQTVFSTGVGGAALEYQIKKSLPKIKLICTEYFPQSVEVLKKVFTEADEITLFDILKGDWHLVKNRYLKDAHSALIMYRLDAGFTNDEWRKIFEAIHAAGIDRIIYIPTTLLTFRSLWNRKSRELKWFVSRTPVSFAGHLRSKKKFQSFWAGLYEEQAQEFGGLKGFYLKKINPKR